MFFGSLIMLRFAETNVAKEEFYGTKKPIKIWDADVIDILISKLVETKNNSKYLIGYLDKIIIPFLILPKMSRYFNTFKVKYKNNKLMSSRIVHDRLLEKYETIWTKIEDFKNIELNALRVYDDRYIKIKIRAILR